jgi:hypothetical protein
VFSEQTTHYENIEKEKKHGRKKMDRMCINSGFTAKLWATLLRGADRINDAQDGYISTNKIIGDQGCFFVKPKNSGAQRRQS